MRRQIFGWMTAAALTAALASGCGGSGGDASSFNLPVLPGSTENEQNIQFVVDNFGAGDKGWVVASTAGSKLDDMTAQDIKAQASSRYLTKTLAVAKDDSADPAKTVYSTNYCGTGASLEELKNLKPNSSLTARVEGKVNPRFDGKPSNFRTQLFAPVSTDNSKMDVVKVLDDSQTIHCNILCTAEVTRNEEGGVTHVEPLITAEQALKVAKVFDYQNPYDLTKPGEIGIYERVTGLLGHEWNFNPVGGRDGDTRVNIVLCSGEIMGDSEEEGSSVLFGLVRYGDVFSATNVPNSNEGEYIYINYNALGGADCMSLYGTIAHEFTHLVQINSKLIKDGTFANLTGQSSGASIYQNINNEVECLSIAEGNAETSATMAGFGVSHSSDPAVGADGVAFDAINRYLGGESIQREGTYGATVFPADFFVPSYYVNQDPYGIGHLFGLHVISYYGLDKWAELTKSSYIEKENLEETLGASTAEILHRFNIALTASPLTSVPAQYKIPYLAFGAENYVMLNGLEAPELMKMPSILETPYATVATGAVKPVEASFLPWSECLLKAVCPGTAEVTVNLTVPKNAKVNMIFESGGIYQKLY